MREKYIEVNKKLVAQMPFLKPLSRISDTIPDEYDYSYTELDAAEIPRGWNALFFNYCLEITPILPDTEEQELINEEREKSFHELFLDFYKRERGVEPDEELVKLLHSIVIKEEEDASDTTEN